jgi:hypothetical protein
VKGAVARGCPWLCAAGEICPALLATDSQADWKLRTEFTLALTKREFYWLITAIVLALLRVLKWLLEK